MVVAVSLDNLDTLREFSAQVGADYPMGSDRAEQAAVEAYRVPVNLGQFAQRSLFIIDPDGILRYVNYTYRIQADYPEVFRILEAIRPGSERRDEVGGQGR